MVRSDVAPSSLLEREDDLARLERALARARYGLDEEALLIAARAAVAAPDRVIIIEVKARSLA